MNRSAHPDIAQPFSILANGDIGICIKEATVYCSFNGLKRVRISNVNCKGSQICCYCYSSFKYFFLSLLLKKKLSNCTWLCAFLFDGSHRHLARMPSLLKNCKANVYFYYYIYIFFRILARWQIPVVLSIFLQLGQRRDKSTMRARKWVISGFLISHHSNRISEWDSNILDQASRYHANGIFDIIRVRLALLEALVFFLRLTFVKNYLDLTLTHSSPILL